jgi:hypothetical protein
MHDIPISARSADFILIRFILFLTEKIMIQNHSKDYTPRLNVRP